MGWCRCLYCDALLWASGSRGVPAVDDDRGWADEERTHNAGCTWVRTRAFQITQENVSEREKRGGAEEAVK